MHAREHGDPSMRERSSASDICLELAAVDRLVTWARDAELRRDRLPRGFVVAGDHDRPYTRLAAARDGLLHAGTRRVDLPEQAEQRDAPTEGIEALGPVDLSALDDPDGENAQGPAPPCDRPPLRRPRRRFIRDARSCHTSFRTPQSSSTTSGAPLRTTRGPSAYVVLRGHQLRPRIERELRPTRSARAELRREHPSLDRERHERDLGRIPDRRHRGSSSSGADRAERRCRARPPRASAHVGGIGSISRPSWRNLPSGS
jgi:hypothetical protein